MLILLRDNDRNGGPNHKRSTINPQQASRMITNTFKLFFNHTPKKHKFLANIPRASILVNLPADGQLLFTPPIHKTMKDTIFVCVYIIAIHYCVTNCAQSEFSLVQLLLFELNQ